MLKTSASLILILLTMLPLCGFGQEFTVSGTVSDMQNNPVSFVNVIVRTQQDSTIVKGTSTDDDGFYKLINLEKGAYVLQYSFIGFKPISKLITIENDMVLETIVLEEDAESLDEISIVAKRPTITKEADKLVFNIENTALIEGDMLQVIRSTPGVLVLDSGISIKGSSPTIYINNKKIQLTADELIQLLESSSANSIKSVEVITNPSAKYDADSGAVINIVMSKNLITGYRGSVFTNYTQGVFPRYNAGTSHFFKNSKINLNLNYSYTKSKINRDGEDIVNYLDTNFNTDEVWESFTNRNTWSETHNLNFNFDYFVNDHNTLSLSSTALYVPYFKYRISNNSTIYDDNSVFLSRFDANNLSRDNKYNIGLDLDYVHQFKESGTLAFNSHFTTYDYSRLQKVASNFYDVNNVFNSATAFNTKANQDTKIFTSKLDYQLPIQESAVFETGIKYSNIDTKSDITQYDVDVNTGDQQIDLLNTDAFDYKEKVFSAYSNFSSDTDVWSLNFGLRAEQTNIEGISIATNQINTQDYLEWFPTASIQHNISEGFNFYINYNRSIARPSYTNLNPFRFFLNDNYVITGNPNLKPTFLDHYVVGTTLFDSFTVEAYYQNYDGNIYEIPRQNNTTNIIEFTSVNFDKTVEFGFDVSTYFNITDNWFVYTVASLYNIEEEINFGDGFVNRSQWSLYGVLQNDFTFLKDKSLSANITLSWLGKNLLGLQTVRDRLFSDLSISKTILKKRAVISLAVSDLFNYQDEDLVVDYLNQSNTRFTDVDNRYIKLGFRYKFGNTKLQTNARTSDLEERNRLKDLN